MRFNTFARLFILVGVITLALIGFISQVFIVWLVLTALAIFMFVFCTISMAVIGSMGFNREHIKPYTFSLSNISSYGDVVAAFAREGAVRELEQYAHFCTQGEGKTLVELLMFSLITFRAADYTTVSTRCRNKVTPIDPIMRLKRTEKYNDSYARMLFDSYTAQVNLFTVESANDLLRNEFEKNAAHMLMHGVTVFSLGIDLEKGVLYVPVFFGAEYPSFSKYDRAVCFVVKALTGIDLNSDETEAEQV